MAVLPNSSLIYIDKTGHELDHIAVLRSIVEQTYWKSVSPDVGLK